MRPFNKFGKLIITVVLHIVAAHRTIFHAVCTVGTISCAAVGAVFCISFNFAAAIGTILGHGFSSLLEFKFMTMILSAYLKKIF